MSDNLKTTENAVVVGASMAGLLAARVLSEHFTRVSVVERDSLVDDGGPRRGVPQGHHLHALLDQGREILEVLFPGLIDDIGNDGGLVLDPGQDLIWYQAGGYRPRRPTDLQFLSVSRPFLEQHVRQRVRNLKNVTLHTGLRLKDLQATDQVDRVTGVIVKGEDGNVERLDADLVVDAMGRRSPLPKWLDESGFGTPKTEEITMWMGYATRLWRRDPDDTPLAYMIQPAPPEERRAGFMVPIEGDRWMSSVGGWGTDHHAPTDDAGYLEFARSLPAPDIYELMTECEPLTQIRPQKFPSSIRRRYEKMDRFPEGLLAIGDAVSSFNPIYGQGMSSAAMQAKVLDSQLRSDHIHDLASHFFEAASEVIDIPWTLAAGADFRFDTTEGNKRPGTDLINRYLYRFNRAMNQDLDLLDAWVDVINLTKPATSLFHPKLAWRLLRKPDKSPVH